MHPHSSLLETLYNSLNKKDHAGMAACYHPDAEFEDIAFTLRGKSRIHAMWHMISEGDLQATFTIREADDQAGVVDVVDDYTFRDTGRRVHNVIRSEFRFRDELIISHHDYCDALKWGMQALGPVKGFMSWLVPSKRREMAMAKLEKFIAEHSEYV
jgi:ketosteroid isomerase-like protein